MKYIVTISTKVQSKLTNDVKETDRSSRPEVFCKKGVLRNFAKFTGKHLCQSLFFNKVAGLRPSTLLKKRLWYRCFPFNFFEIFKNPFFYRTPLVAAFKQKTNLKLRVSSHVRFYPRVNFFNLTPG